MLCSCRGWQTAPRRYSATGLRVSHVASGTDGPGEANVCSLDVSPFAVARSPVQFCRRSGRAVALPRAQAAGGSAGGDNSSFRGGLEGMMSAAADPVQVARAFVGPSLLEMDLSMSGVGQQQPTSLLTLERWRDAYGALAEDAVGLGIPRSAVPSLAPDACPAEIQAARDHLQSLLESFLSAGL